MNNEQIYNYTYSSIHTGVPTYKNRRVGVHEICLVGNWNNYNPNEYSIHELGWVKWIFGKKFY